MKHIKFKHLSTIFLFSAFFASTAGALPSKQDLKFIEKCESFNLSSSCRPPAKPKPPRTNFIKDEVVLLYSSKNQKVIRNVTKKYNLKPKSKVILPSVSLGMVVADTKGKNPLNLVETISKKEKKVKAGTNNVYRPATMVSKDVANNRSKKAYSMYETGVQQVHATTKGNGILICMVDTPVDIFHPSLSNSLVETLDLIDFDPKNLETQTHGTSIAGVLISQNEYIGIAPESKLFAISAFSITKERPFVMQGTSSNIAKAIDRCILQKANVINLSFTGGKDELVERMVKKAISKGITVVAAGGNGGHWGSTIYPALIPGVLTATAVDENQKLYAKANKGRFIDFSAPGVNVLTIAPGGKYNISSGTSLSAAHISGVAALLLSQKKNAQVETMLAQTAQDLGKPGRDQEFGEGLISASNALSRLKQ